ncbi:zincin-like metallopeptidase domain-containing protein [Variovorax sp. J22R133]|nr:zincin-like metallopeptidase domain-containing protein [Variovorax sp. J22R133]MDM0116792.1 zincin-like metallopeptidase domain-containing protein [Variovorax sp. J22R133]
MDVRQSVTDRIIAMLEKGGNVFRERWTRAASRGMPRNGKTGAPYHGANVLLLWDAAIEAGYSSNVWLTYKQAASLGAQVRKGERAVLCAHFERRAGKASAETTDASQGIAGRDANQGNEGDQRDQGDEAGAGGTAGRSFLLCTPFWVFNVAQIAGLPVEFIDEHCYPPAPAYSPTEMAMRIVAGANAQIRHGFEQAMYVMALDEIRMPWPRRFTSAQAHYATILHELVHWSGHPERLHRAFGQRFGDAAYAFEELVAELGSAFLLGHCGLVDATIEGHAAYLDSWLQVLRNDRTAIFTAARLAGEAYEFLLSLALPEMEDASASQEDT